jgi:hypothetical protein
VNTLAEALNEASSIANVPGLLKQIIGNDMWRKRYCKQIKQDVEFRRFPDFVTAHPPEGLGTNMRVLEAICRHSGDNEAYDMLVRMGAGEGGGDNNPYGRNGKPNDLITVDIVNSDSRPTGNSAAAALRRLAKDTPELHAQVLAGELSPNAAAIEAGFRKRKFQLPDDAIAAGRYLAGRVDKEWLLAMVDEFMKRIEA